MAVFIDIMWGNALTQFLEHLDPCRGNRTLLDHQRWAADMEPEGVIAVNAPGLAVSTRSIETLPNTLHVGATFEVDGRLKGFVHEIEAEGFGEQHSYSSTAAILVRGHGAVGLCVYKVWSVGG